MHLCTPNESVDSRALSSTKKDGDIVTIASDGNRVKSGMELLHNGRTGHKSLLLVWILRLIEEEVGGQLLVLVACKVSLNDKVALEPKAT
jgi:hypothetical protein